MRKNWVVYALALSLVASLLMPAEKIHASETSVKVMLPKFKVSLNGHTVENQYRQYPLLVYRDITYVPMTWYDTRQLGLEASWSPSVGLDIKQSKVTTSYALYKADSRNAATYTANISTSAITVNGKVINNSKEQYPLLSFRSVAYFPLTWRFAHDEFGWDYKWDASNGLRIISHNPQLLAAELPAYAWNNDVALYKGHYYFVKTGDSSNHIYRAPASQSSAIREIFTYNFNDDYDLQPEKVTFQIRDDALWFTYHRGEGVLGRDNYVKIGDDGMTNVVDSGYLRDFRDTPYGILIINNAITNEYGNLYFKEGTNIKPVGDPDVLQFAQSITDENGLTATSVVGDHVYVLCRKGDSDSNFFYKINLKTNQTEKLIDSSVDWFRIANNKLYYVRSEDHNLYSSTLDGTREMKLSENPVSWFDSIKGHIFYKTEIGLHMIDSNGTVTLVWASPVAKANVINDSLVFQLYNNNGFVILDGSGSLILKVAEPITHFLTSDEVFVQLTRDSSIQLIR
jgi:hypothetical protein